MIFTGVGWFVLIYGGLCVALLAYMGLVALYHEWTKYVQVYLRKIDWEPDDELP
jgi:hypothetical protein